jgi:hypothetical protein
LLLPGLEYSFVAGQSSAHWAAYNARQQARAVRLLCREVLAAAGVGAGRVAIDFGCGGGVETRAMLTSGWRVLALDGEPGTPDRVLSTTQGSAQERLTIDHPLPRSHVPTGGGLGVRRVLAAVHPPR